MDVSVKSIEDFRNRYYSNNKDKSMLLSNKRKYIKTFQINDDFSIVLKILEDAEVEIVAIVDSDIAKILGETAIYQDKYSSARGVYVALIYVVYDKDGNKKYIRDDLTIADLVAKCRGVVREEGYDTHHIIYYRDERWGLTQIVTDSEHGKLGGAKIKTDDEFREYVRTELFKVDNETFTRILSDLWRLGNIYKKKSGIYLESIDIKQVTLNSILDDIDKYVTLSVR